MDNRNDAHDRDFDDGDTRAACSICEQLVESVRIDGGQKVCPGCETTLDLIAEAAEADHCDYGVAVAVCA
jgi:hypothetical protein